MDFEIRVPVYLFVKKRLVILDNKSHVSFISLQNITILCSLPDIHAILEVLVFFLNAISLQRESFKDGDSPLSCGFHTQ